MRPIQNEVPNVAGMGEGSLQNSMADTRSPQTYEILLSWSQMAILIQIADIMFQTSQATVPLKF
jgi:hypothetical protein